MDAMSLLLTEVTEGNLAGGRLGAVFPEQRVKLRVYCAPLIGVQHFSHSYKTVGRPFDETFFPCRYARVAHRAISGSAR